MANTLKPYCAQAHCQKLHVWNSHRGHAARLLQTMPHHSASALWFFPRLQFCQHTDICVRYKFFVPIGSFPAIYCWANCTIWQKTSFVVNTGLLPLRRLRRAVKTKNAQNAHSLCRNIEEALGLITVLLPRLPISGLVSPLVSDLVPQNIHRVSKKLCQCYFLNNSVKHWPTLIIFGMQHHKETWRKLP